MIVNWSENIQFTECSLTTFCEVMGNILFVKSVSPAIGHPEDPRHGGC